MEMNLLSLTILLRSRNLTTYNIATFKTLQIRKYVHIINTRCASSYNNFSMIGTGTCIHICGHVPVMFSVMFNS